MTTVRRLASLSALCLWLVAGAASAHHSYSNIDLTKTVALAGTVKQFDIVNPHSWLHLVSVDAKGVETEWALEMGGPQQIYRQGWSAQIVKAGDHVSVNLHPMLDGSHSGQLISATLADGKVLGGDAPFQAPAP